MFWPIVLPIQITFGVCLVVFVVVLLVSKKQGWKSNRAFLRTTLLLSLAFMPSCGVVMSVLDQYRFGVFEYANFQSIDDFRIERYLPEPATEITLEKNAQGYRSKFKISKSDLNHWFEQQWQQNYEQSVVSRTEIDETAIVDTEEFDLWFGGLGWSPLSEAVVYEGPRAANGSGFTIWYSESTVTAYQHAGYW